MAVDNAPRTLARRWPSPGLWLAAVAELGVALAVAMIVLRAGGSPSGHAGAGHGVSGRYPQSMPETHWGVTSSALTLVTAALLAWWLTTRARTPAVLAAIGLVCLGVSEPVRVLALHSHLIRMAALEVLLVGVPLLLVSAWRAPTAHRRHSSLWTLWVIAFAGLNSALLIALHLPGLHDRGAELGLLPVWLPILIVSIGTGYWTAVLGTAGRVRPAPRRAALVIGQEIAAVLGLAALVAPSPPTMDQRLGGLLMIITCAAVTLPLLKRLDTPQDPRRLRMEHDVH